MKLPLIQDMYIPELKWLLVAEELNNSKTLYLDIISKIDPLFALIYKFLNSFFGRTLYGYRIFSILLVAIQAIYFNYIVKARYLTIQKNFLPAFFYMVFMSLSADQNLLSPALIATTFILIALNIFFIQLEKSAVTDRIFECGLALGIAFVIHFPSFVFVFWLILSSLMFSSITIRQVFLIVFGFTIPYLIIVVYFYFSGALPDLQSQWLLSFTFSNFNFLKFFLPFTLPMALAFLGALKAFSSIRYSSFQNKAQQVLFFLGFFGIISSFLSYPSSPYQLTYYLPSIAFFCTVFFVNIKKNFVAETSFLFFIAFLFILSFQNSRNIFNLDTSLLSNIEIVGNEVNEDLKGKRIVVTGNHPSVYYNAKLGSSYLEWNLSKNMLSDLDSYQGLVNINEKLISEQPEVIIDYENIMPLLFKRLPDFAIKYKQTGKFTYTLK